VTRNTGVPTGFGNGFEPDRGSIVRFVQLWLHFCIWVLIASCHGEYVNCSAWAALLPPAFKFAIWLIFVEWLWHNCWIQAKLAGYRSRLNEYLSDLKSPTGRWKSNQNCTISVLIMLWYNQNSNTSLEQEMLPFEKRVLCGNLLQRFSSGLEPDPELTQGFGPVANNTYAEYRLHRIQRIRSIVHTKYSIHRVHHTPSTAGTKYSIHLVQYTLCTAYPMHSIHTSAMFQSVWEQHTILPDTPGNLTSALKYF
jgi:hypothetical protein